MSNTIKTLKAHGIKAVKLESGVIIATSTVYTKERGTFTEYTNVTNFNTKELRTYLGY